MTLDDLIHILEDLRDEIGTGEIDVAVQLQPTYPLRAAVTGVTTASEIARAELDAEIAYARRFGDEIDAADVEIDLPEEVIYFVTAESTSYGHRAAWEIARRW